MLKLQLLQVLLLLIVTCFAEDSLQGALNAVHRRQRDLSRYSRYNNYGNVNLNDYNDNRKSELEQLVYEYLENSQDYQDTDDPFSSPSRFFTSSPFRERAVAGKTKLRSLPRIHLLQTTSALNPNEDNHVEYLNERYPGVSEDTSRSLYSSPYKRGDHYNYNSLGYNGVGLRKRNNIRNAHQRESADEDDDNVEGKGEYSGIYPGGVYGIYKARQHRVPFYPVTKRFPVAKRSMKMNDQHEPKQVKRTDPKVEKELSQLFTTKKGKDSQNGPSEVKPQKENISTTKKPLALNKSTSSKPTTPKSTNQDVDKPNKPLQMSKKSVKWSDYFGIDRRKKSSELDDEWLLDRYHKAVELAKTKKSEEYPLKTFHKHDTSVSTQSSNEKPSATLQKSKLKPKLNKVHLTKSSPTENVDIDMDSIEVLDDKLRSIEESIIDDTLKFTGASSAHDDIGGEELMDVKDSIISRLATAYNVEKMRKALKEYRQSLVMRQFEDKDISNEESGEDEKIEDEKKKEKRDKEEEKEKKKRVAVGRKYAIDEDRKDVDEDNNIKCTERDENCAEQNYPVPREFLEQATFEKGGCDRIERACREVSVVLGAFGSIFETACNMHQMCMLCSDNSWFSPTRQCNILFFSKADQMCDGDISCQRGVRGSLKYLQHVDRIVRSNLNAACSLECPNRR